MNLKNKIFNFFIIYLFFCFNNAAYGSKSSYILLKIDNKIITNTDIENEKKYLLAINENLITLNDSQIFELSKDSLIREKIKRNELEKYYDTSEYNKYLDDIVKDFYLKLNFSNISELEQHLLTKKVKIETLKDKLNIEVLWNQLVFNRYGKKVTINPNKLREKIKNSGSLEKKESLLISEIIFSVNSKSEINEKHKKIIDSIANVGFNNTANIYSVSETAKFGGKIGWITTNQLSKKIFNELKKIKVGEYTDLINVPAGFLILKVVDKKIEKIEINIEEELEQLIIYEKDRQLNEFSSVFFQKIKKNSLIDEK
tara:strand:- start:130 stop:1071 length:942 start_codon:yes stop_codon:yes gene_type:complete